MPKTINSIIVTYDVESSNAARRSFMDLFQLANDIGEGLPGCLAGLFCGTFMSVNDLSDLFGSEPINISASGASELHGFKVKPGDAYLILFSTLARHTDKHCIRISHGWPLIIPRIE